MISTPANDVVSIFFVPRNVCTWTSRRVGVICVFHPKRHDKIRPRTGTDGPKRPWRRNEHGGYGRAASSKFMNIYHEGCHGKSSRSRGVLNLHQIHERENSDGADFRLRLARNEPRNAVERGTRLSKTGFNGRKALRTGSLDSSSTSLPQLFQN